MVATSVPKRESLRKDLYHLQVGKSLVIKHGRRSRAYIYAKALGIRITSVHDPRTGLVTVWRMQ